MIALIFLGWYRESVLLVLRSQSLATLHQRCSKLPPSLGLAAALDDSLRRSKWRAARALVIGS